MGEYMYLVHLVPILSAYLLLQTRSIDCVFMSNPVDSPTDLQLHSTIHSFESLNADADALMTSDSGDD